MTKKTRHDGDCWWFAVKICTCGYLHDIYPTRKGDLTTVGKMKQVEQHEFNLSYLNSLKIEDGTREWPPKWPIRSPEEQKKIDDFMDEAFGER